MFGTYFFVECCIFQKRLTGRGFKAISIVRIEEVPLLTIVVTRVIRYSLFTIFDSRSCHEYKLINTVVRLGWLFVKPNLQSLSTAFWLSLSKAS